MAEIQAASDALGVEARWLQAFEVEDPFNQGIRLCGFLSLCPDQRYGALAVTGVSGSECLQVVHATPKIPYPFGRDGRFRFPPVRVIHVHEKLDGTNVFAYRYRDASEALRTTYKLRLHPVLRNGKWGNFLDMWKEILAACPEIPDLPFRNGCGISFELYGARNPHLVAYDVPLSTAVLFGDADNGALVPPWKINAGSVPLAPLLGSIRAGDDLERRYNEIRQEMEQKIKHLDDGKLSGFEGCVWHIELAGGGAAMFKCKPESVEQIHWAGGINKAAVMATCWNLLETSDDLTYEALKPLLLEEYSEKEIEHFRPHIDGCIRNVRDAAAFREKVLSDYRMTGLSIEKDKASVMRELSKKYPRDQMKRVYGMIAASLGLYEKKKSGKM